MGSDEQAALWARRTRANRVRAGLSALALVLPLLNAPSSSFLPLPIIPLPVVVPSLRPFPPQALTLDSDVDYMLNGHDDDPMASGALSPAPLSNSEDSDNTMQVDSDVDVTRNPDADADGEYDDDEPDGVPPTSGASSSYHNKRVVRGYVSWWCGSASLTL